MGVSSSYLNDPHASLESRALVLRHRQDLIPALPTARTRPVSTQTYNLDPGMANMMRMYPAMGNQIMPQRRPRFGGGFDGGPTICGFCGKMAHPGPCDGEEMPRRGNWPRPPRFMRGGDGRQQDPCDIAAAINNAAAMGAQYMNQRQQMGGCGPTCSANDVSFRVRGKVDDKDVDLKLGGTPVCPCADSGGCGHTHQRARSRSRSRKRR